MSKNAKNANLQMFSELAGRIEMYQEKLSATERQIADYLITHDDCFEQRTIYDLAAEVGTSPAALVRFSKRLGYTGFADMKFHALQRRMSFPQNDIGIRSGDNINVFKQKAVQYTTNSLLECILDTDNRAFEQAIEAISRADLLLFVGNGSASGIARTAMGLFLSIGMRAMQVEDSMLLTRTAAQMTDRDVLITISYNGYSKICADVAMLTKEAGATTILITSCKDSLVGSYSDIILCTPARNTDNVLNISTTDICQLAILQTLQIGVWLSKQPQSGRDSSRMFQLNQLQNYDTRQKSLQVSRIKQAPAP